MLSYPIFFERIPRLGKKEKSPRAKYSENLRNGIRLAIKNHISDFPVQPNAGLSLLWAYGVPRKRGIPHVAHTQ
jgi:hypothetical protein